MVETSSVTSHLRAHGIRPSAQRIAIMRYAMEHLCHPSAEDIYHGLIRDMPTLSRTTVYNTLWLFVEKGAVMQLDIDRTTARFDYVTRPHAHFYCRVCGCIMDVEPVSTQPELSMGDGGLHIEQVNVYYKGLCPKCYKKTIKGSSALKS